MSRTDRVLCTIYGVIAAGALVVTMSQNVLFFMTPDNGGLIGFNQQAKANHAAASIFYDLSFLLLAALTFMIVEARKWKIRFVWVYVVLSLTLAVSVMFPLFMIARQVRMAAEHRS